MARPRRTNVRVPDRYQALVDGELSLEDLDDEEIMRGQLKDKNGAFSGRPPQAIPRQFHTQLVRELMRRMERKMQPHVDLALNTLIEIASNRRAPADARFKAATYLMERVMGKIPDKQIVEATVKKWEEGLGDLMVDVEPPAPAPQPRAKTRRKASGT